MLQRVDEQGMASSPDSIQGLWILQDWGIMLLYDLTPDEERRFYTAQLGMTLEEYFYQEFGEVTWVDPAELPDEVGDVK
jgi:hypothetical protein